MKFTNVPTKIILSSNIDAIEHCLVLVILALNSEEKDAVLTYSKISEFSGVSRRYVVRKISSLVTRSLLKRVRVGKSFKYTINLNQF